MLGNSKLVFIGLILCLIWTTSVQADYIPPISSVVQDTVEIVTFTENAVAPGTGLLTVVGTSGAFDLDGSFIMPTTLSVTVAVDQSTGNFVNNVNNDLTVTGDILNFDWVQENLASSGTVTSFTFDFSEYQSGSSFVQIGFTQEVASEDLFQFDADVGASLGVQVFFDLDEPVGFNPATPFATGFSSTNNDFNFSLAFPVPEPATALLFAGGVLGLIGRRRRG